jgi:hypothetical protein
MSRVFSVATTTINVAFLEPTFLMIFVFIEGALVLVTPRPHAPCAICAVLCFHQGFVSRTMYSIRVSPMYSTEHSILFLLRPCVPCAICTVFCSSRGHVSRVQYVTYSICFSWGHVSHGPLLLPDGQSTLHLGGSLSFLASLHIREISLYRDYFSVCCPLGN